MTHAPDRHLPVYHTTMANTERDEPLPEAWVRFGRLVIEAHQPEGDACLGCGRVWVCCPVVVAARQTGLGAELILTSPVPLPRRAPSMATSRRGMA